MSREILLALLMCLAIGNVCAAVYVIGTDTTSDSSVPVNGNNDYGWSKMIFTKAEINTAGLNTAGVIAGIGLYVDNLPANYTFQNQRIFLRSTATSTYSSANDVMPDSTLFTQVFAGNITFQGDGWLQVAFTASFSWDNTQNIEILWKNRDGSRQTGCPIFRYTSTSANYRTTYKNADAAFPTGAGTRTYNRPNLQLITPMLPGVTVAVYPADAGWGLMGSSLLWKSGGGCPTSYDVYFGTANPPVTLVSDNQTSVSYTPALATSTTYFWKIVPSNSTGSPTSCPVWSFRTPASVQLAESFEAVGFPPADWLNPGGYSLSQNFPFHGSQDIYVAAGISGALIGTPLLTISSGSRLSFCARTASITSNARIRIRYSADGSTWTTLGSAVVLPASTSWSSIEVDLSTLAGHDYRLGLEAYNAGSSGNVYVYLDHIIAPNRLGTIAAPITAINRNGSFTTVSWLGVPGATGYRIYASDDPYTWSSTPLTSVGSGVLTYSQQVSARLYFRVTAFSE